MKKLLRREIILTTMVIILFPTLLAATASHPEDDLWVWGDWERQSRFWIRWYGSGGTGKIGTGTIYVGSDWIELDDDQNKFQWTNGRVATSGLRFKLSSGGIAVIYYKLAISVLSKTTVSEDAFEWYLIGSWDGLGYHLIDEMISPNDLRDSYLFPSDVSGYSYMYVSMYTYASIPYASYHSHNNAKILIKIT